MDEPAARLREIGQRAGSFWAEHKPLPWWSWWHLPELAAVFAIGLCLMNFLYAGTGGVMGDEIAVPGHDSYYHVKMAVLLPEIGLVDELPWLRHSYFTETGHEFVSHHYGFHVLLTPFVHAAGWLRGDHLVGGRWATATFFAACLTLFQLILMTQRIRCRWLWLALYLVMPSQFFSRHAFVRAIAPSLLFMLAIIVFMFRRRYALAGLVVAGYTHLYFGGVIFAPLIVICYALAGLIGPRGDRVSWRLWAWTLGGWVVGVLTHPYAGGMFEFLRLQVFGTGLTPDISVGSEWKPYKKVWWVATMCGGTLIPWAVAVALRLRLGRRANAKELSVLLMSFVFAGLMLKSRRFVEYWPPLTLLSAALLGGPVLSDWYERLERWLRNGRRWWPPVLIGLALVGLGVAAGVQVWRVGPDLGLRQLTDEWRMWALVAGGYLLVPLARLGVETRPVISPGPYAGLRLTVDVLMPLVAGALGTAAVVGILGLAADGLPISGQRFLVPWWCFGGLAAVYLLVSLVAGRWTPRRAVGAGWLGGPRWRLGLGWAAIVTGGATLTAGLTLAAGPQVVRLQRSLRGKFDLPAIREAMAFLTANSAENSVVFTDDWDIFPVYFYVNHYNNFCVGLDPKFTHARDPVLWERYKKITRAKTPTRYEVPPEQRRYSDGEKEVPIRIEDIRDHFAAQYVITDLDHTAFRKKLDRATTFCRRIFPQDSGHSAPDAEQTANGDGTTKRAQPPYVIHRVFSRAEQQAAEEQADLGQRARSRGPGPARRRGGRPSSQPRGGPTSAPTWQPEGE